MIAIIDYGAGNLRSITNACKFIGYEVNLISEPKDLDIVEKVILPGVGHFGNAMEKL